MLRVQNLVGHEKSMYGFSKIVKYMARISMAVSQFFSTAGDFSFW
jgi:hypothetical protein